MSVPVLQIVTDALLALNVYQPGAPIKTADSDVCLTWLNAILDDWNAERQAVYSSVFASYVTTPNLNPHTIGPSGTWTMAARPVSIDGAWLFLSAGLYQPMYVTRDPAWWANRYGYATSTPMAVYYAPDEPNGSLYFVGIPSAAVTIRLLTRTVLGSVVLTDSLQMPPGYRSALTLTLMEAVAEIFGRPVTDKLTRRAGKARARAFANNVIVPTLTSEGQGLPASSGGWYDYRTGQWNP